jgi:hypothetical protein
VVQVSMDWPDLLDARFSNVVQSDELTKRDMEAAGFLGMYKLLHSYESTFADPAGCSP